MKILGNYRFYGGNLRGAKFIGRRLNLRVGGENIEK
jgi:hypothetical protein